MHLDRRRLLALVGGAGLATAATVAGSNGRAEAPRRVRAKIVIIGAGAAGTALANRLVRRLEGAEITVVEPTRVHWYQPGFSLIAAGLKPASYAVSMKTDWLPQGVSLVPEAVTAVDPEARTVTTDAGTTLGFDVLVLSCGLTLDHDAIEGFSLDLVGRNGIGALYAGPEYAARTFQAASAFADAGGVGLFTRPATEMKCAGAPLKHTFLVDDLARRRGTNRTITYVSPTDNLFSVPIVSEKVRMLFDERGIGTHYNNVLTAIDAGKKTATFAAPNGAVTRSSTTFTSSLRNGRRISCGRRACRGPTDGRIRGGPRSILRRCGIDATPTSSPSATSRASRRARPRRA